MEIPQYLIDALYQFSQDALDERVKYDALLAEAEADALTKEKHKESWLSHLFGVSKSK